MARLLFRCVCVLIFAGHFSIASTEVDPIEESLTAAKEENNEKEIETAQAAVLDTLTTRAAAEQAAGNLDATEITHAEIAAFEVRGESLPHFGETVKKTFEPRYREAELLRKFARSRDSKEIPLLVEGY